MVTEQINDRLGPGGLSSVAVFREDANGNTVLVGADGTIYPVSRNRTVVKWSNTSFNGTVGNGATILLDSLVIPAGSVGVNGRVEVEVAYELSGANAKDPLVRIGHGTNGWSTGAVNLVNPQGLTTAKGYRNRPTIVNKGALNSNKIWAPQHAGFGQTGSAAHVDSAVDFGQDVTIYFGGVMSNALADPADIVRLMWYTVWITY